MSAAPSRLTVANLCAMGILSHADGAAASDAYRQASGAVHDRLAASHAVDVAAAIHAFPFAAPVIRDPLMGVTVRRAAVRSAVRRALPFSLYPSAGGLA